MAQSTEFINNASRYGSHYLLKKVAASLFGIFIPIYLYANGFSLIQVGLFYLCQEAVNVIFTYVLYKNIYLWGVRNVLIVATLAQIVLLFMVYRFLGIN